jgi:hypothetical protein
MGVKLGLSLSLSLSHYGKNADYVWEQGTEENIWT